LANQINVLCVSTRDTSNINSGKSQYAMTESLKSETCNLQRLQYPKPLKPLSLRWIVHKLKSIDSSSDTDIGVVNQSKRHAEQLKRELEALEFDVLFAPMGSDICAYLNISQPIIYLSDSTFCLMNGYYSPESTITGRELLEREKVAHQINNNAAFIVLSNDWAAQSTIATYDVAPEKVRVIRSGPNFDKIVSQEELTKPHDNQTIKLLMVGIDWQRKGGNIGLEAMDWLKQQGYDATLTVCGMKPPKNIHNKNIKFIRYLDKNNPVQCTKLKSLYANSHFLLFPSRTECHGIATIEANAFGLPVLANNTGGVASYIKNNINGYLFSRKDRGKDYAQKAVDIFNDSKHYHSLRESSRLEYENHLNWKKWSKEMHDVIEQVYRNAK